MTLYMWEEEVLYARNKGLLTCDDSSGSLQLPVTPARRKEVYAFYASMRNQGKLLARSPVLESDPEISSPQEESKGGKPEKR